MTPATLGQLNLHIPVTPLFIFSVTALLFLGWAIFTVVIRYHWKNYSIRKIEVFTMNFFYLVGSAFFIVLLAIIALLYFGSSGGTP